MLYCWQKLVESNSSYQPWQIMVDRPKPYNHWLAVKGDSMEPQLDYWRKFKGAFQQELTACSRDDFSTAWKTSTNRTRFYEENLLPRVADSLQLKFLKEEFKIDYSLCKETPDGYLVPLVFVESENIATGIANSELRKLCLLYSPLKVLITCVEWSDEPGYWRSGGLKAQLTEKWSNIIRAHNAILPQL